MYISSNQEYFLTTTHIVITEPSALTVCGIESRKHYHAFLLSGEMLDRHSKSYLKKNVKMITFLDKKYGIVSKFNYCPDCEKFIKDRLI